MQDPRKWHRALFKLSVPSEMEQSQLMAEIPPTTTIMHSNVGEAATLARVHERGPVAQWMVG